MPCSIPSTLLRSAQFLSLGERRRGGEAQASPGTALGSFCMSLSHSLGFSGNLVPPPHPLPREDTSCPILGRTLPILGRAEGNNQAKVLLCFGDRTPFWQVRQSSSWHSSRGARMCGPGHLSSQLTQPLLSSSRTEGRHEMYLQGTGK